MKNRIKRIIPYWPEALILLLCCVLLLFEIGRKEGYHMDELLSFELANAEFNPWIVPTQPQGRLAKFVKQELRGESAGETFSNLAATVKDVLQNRRGSKLLSYTADVYEEPVWIDRDTFRDYITVDKEDDFHYLSVYFNVKDDNHPPLHFMALHTVSSIFKGRIAPLMGCGINLVCVLGVMLLLMKLGRQFMRLAGREDCMRLAGDGAALLYGLSAGAVATTLLIRMYAMLTFFCVALLEIHVSKIYRERLGGEGFERGNKKLVLVTLLGFWTQYFFLFYCLILAAVTTALLWMERRTKELGRYVVSMILAAVIGVAVFPFAVSDVFSSGRGVEALENLSAGFSGYGERMMVFLQIVAKREGVACIALLLAIWAVCVVVRLCKEKDMSVTSGSAWIVLIVPAFGYFLLAARMSPYLVDRYMMPIFPLVMLTLVLLSFGEFVRFFPAKGEGAKNGRNGLAALAAVLAICQVFGLWCYGDDYLYPLYAEQRKVAEEYASCPCICVYQGVGYYENLLEFMRYERTLLLRTEELAERVETESVRGLDKVVVIVKERDDLEPVKQILRQKYGLEETRILWEDGSAEDDIVMLFERNEL